MEIIGAVAATFFALGMLADMFIDTYIERAAKAGSKPK
jgi:hypothetical protein